MIILDENVPESQRVALARWKPLKIGYDLWTKGTQDEQIAVRLRHERNVTLFTLDRDFYNERRQYAHANCAIVFVDAPLDRFAAIVDRFLRHPSFRTHASRKGLVIKLTITSISTWRAADGIVTGLLW